MSRVLLAVTHTSTASSLLHNQLWEHLLCVVDTSSARRRTRRRVGICARHPSCWIRAGLSRDQPECVTGQIPGRSDLLTSPSRDILNPVVSQSVPVFARAVGGALTQNVVLTEDPPISGRRLVCPQQQQQQPPLEGRRRRLARRLAASLLRRAARRHSRRPRCLAACLCPSL